MNNWSLNEWSHVRPMSQGVRGSFKLGQETVAPSIISSTQWRENPGILSQPLEPHPVDSISVKFSGIRRRGPGEYEGLSDQYPDSPQKNNLVSSKELAALLPKLYHSSGLLMNLKQFKHDGNGSKAADLIPPSLHQALLDQAGKPELFYEKVVQTLSSQVSHLNRYLETYESYLFQKYPKAMASEYFEIEIQRMNRLVAEKFPEMIQATEKTSNPNIVLKQWFRANFIVLTKLFSFPEPKDSPLSAPSRIETMIDFNELVIQALKLDKPHYLTFLFKLVKSDPDLTFLLNEYPFRPRDAAFISDKRWKEAHALYQRIGQGPGPSQGGFFSRSAQGFQKMLQNSGMASTWKDRLDVIPNIRLTTAYMGLPVSDAVWHQKTKELFQKMDAGIDPFQEMGRSIYEVLYKNQLLDVQIKQGVTPTKSSVEAPSPESFQDKKFQGKPFQQLVAFLDSNQNELFSVIRQNQSLSHGKLYQGMRSGIKNVEESSFLSLLPHLLFSYPPDGLNALWRELETQFENKKRFNGYYTNEAEMLLLLRHPQNPNREKLSPITQALTSVFGFLNTHKISTVNDSLVKAWGDIGFLTHGFQFWKYDSQGGEESLFAKFGFKAISTMGQNKLDPSGSQKLIASEKNLQNPDPVSMKYGKGFWYQKDANSPLILFRRGFLMVSHPEQGTLVIRNSSPEFGRNLLPHPAYWMKESVDIDQIKAFDPYQEKRLNHIMTPSLYQKGPLDKSKSTFFQWTGKEEKLQQEKFKTALPQLTQALLHLKDNYRRWKFDTEAFDSDGFKGHLSPGFSKLLNHVRYLGFLASLDSSTPHNTKLPDLAFVHPHYPPWESYAYSPINDTDQGAVSKRFKLTPQHLKEMADYLEYAQPISVLMKTDWAQFLKAGIDHQAELVLLAPLPDSLPGPLPGTLNDESSSPLLRG
ncbi:MAG: hypothetical protein K2X66_12765 [Cyanobacteria bacterium]|nr:hypothetical protein [Cyanobacteriota bacterium]